MNSLMKGSGSYTRRMANQLAMINRHHPEVIIADLVMLKMNSLQFLKRLILEQ